MVFKHGSQGLGVLQRCGHQNHRIGPGSSPDGKLYADEVNDQGTCGATLKEAKEDAPKTTPAIAKQMLARRNPAPDGPEDLPWADDGSLSALSK